MKHAPRVRIERLEDLVSVAPEQTLGALTADVRYLLEQRGYEFGANEWEKFCAASLDLPTVLGMMLPVATKAHTPSGPNVLQIADCRARSVCDFDLDGRPIVRGAHEAMSQ